MHHVFIPANSSGDVLAVVTSEEGPLRTRLQVTQNPYTVHIYHSWYGKFQCCVREFMKIDNRSFFLIVDISALRPFLAIFGQILIGIRVSKILNQDQNGLTRIRNIGRNQGCGSAFILCGSGSGSFYECGSGSGSRSSFLKL